MRIWKLPDDESGDCSQMLRKLSHLCVLQIPVGTDILVTHTPPVGYGDRCATGVRAGCVELLNTVQRRVKPKYHIYGHIHEGIEISAQSPSARSNR